MKYAALICGLVGGLISLFVGVFGNALFSLAGAGGWADAGLYQFLSYALPILAMVGGGLALSNATWGAVLMAASALGTVMFFGLGGFSMLPVALIGAGAALGLVGGLSKTVAAPADAREDHGV